MGRLRASALLFTLMIVVAAGCGGGDDGGDDGGTEAAGGEGGGGPITFWTTEELPDRVAIQREIISGFTEASGIEVELNPVAEDEMNIRRSVPTPPLRRAP